MFLFYVLFFFVCVLGGGGDSRSTLAAENKGARPPPPPPKKKDCYLGQQHYTVNIENVAQYTFSRSTYIYFHALHVGL